MTRRNSLVVPGAAAALEQMKYEIASELGIAIPADGYYGHLLTREVGQLGGQMTRRLVELAQEQISRTNR